MPPETFAQLIDYLKAHPMVMSNDGPRQFAKYADGGIWWDTPKGCRYTPLNCMFGKTVVLTIVPTGFSVVLADVPGFSCTFTYVEESK